MKHETQTTQPGIITGIETVECRGHELSHLEEKLKTQGKRLLTLWPVCQSSWRCVVAPLPDAAGRAGSLPTAQAIAANQGAMDGHRSAPA